jgi:hypothetical protein
MLQNRLIITKKNEREKIYNSSKNKWIIEFDDDKLNNWEDFYDIMQKEIDVLDYNKKFGMNTYTYDDFARDIALFHEVKKRKKDGIVIILDYTEKFKNISEEEKGDIYYSIIYTLLLEWYRDEAIIYKDENPTIDIEVYVLIDEFSLEDKFSEFRNELIIGIEKDREEIEKELKGSILLKHEDLTRDKIFLEKLEEIRVNSDDKLKVVIINSDILRFTTKNYILIDIVDKILIEKYKKNQEIKVYMIFENNI